MVVCDIYMWFLIYCVELWFLIYIYALLFIWKSKKQKKNVVALPNAMAIALGKENLKKIKTGFPECLGAMALGKEF